MLAEQGKRLFNVPSRIAMTAHEMGFDQLSAEAEPRPAAQDGAAQAAPERAWERPAPSWDGPSL